MMEMEEKKDVESQTASSGDSEENLCGCLVVDACGCIEDACQYEASACTCYLDPCACQIP